MPVSCRTRCSWMSHHTQSHPGAGSWSFLKAAWCSAAPPPARSWDPQSWRRNIWSSSSRHQHSPSGLLVPCCHITGSALPRLLELHGRRLQHYSLLPPRAPGKSEQAVVKQEQSRLLYHGRHPSWARTLLTAGGEEVLGERCPLCIRVAEAALSPSLAIRARWPLHMPWTHAATSRQLSYI